MRKDVAAVCFVYEHWRPDRGECFYVGKGSREGRSRDFRNRTRWHHAVVAKLAKLGLKVEVRIFASGLTEREAYDAERARIAYWRERGAPLVNLTDGGEGESGRRTSKATRERMRAAAALRNQDPEYREKLSEATKRSWTDERRARASEIRKGQRSGIRRGPPTEETRAKISAANKGRKRAPLSAETRAKISAANRGKVITAAQRKAISAANTGLKRSSERRCYTWRTTALQVDSAPTDDAPARFDSGGIWSLWDMVANFSAAGLIALQTELGLLVSMSNHNRGLEGRRGDATPIDPKYHEAITQAREGVRDVLKAVENLKPIMPCPHVGAAADRLAYWLNDDVKRWDELFTRVCGLRDALRTEFREYLFYAYPKDRGQKLKSWGDDWKAIIEAFPAVLSDAYSATDCYALRHETASVFHSMRVAEHGLRALARERRLRLPKNKVVEWATWQEIITALDNEIKRIGQQMKAGKAKDAALAFYSGARADLNGFKDEYRNSVAHVRESYDEFQALRALTKVHAFMERLAAYVGEGRERINWRRVS